jgi:ribonuclease R
MAKAIYSERNIGHFGLNFDYYSHFTSPIRRYPDLVVHRLLKEYTSGISAKRREQIYQRISAIAQHSSERERIAMEAERAATKVLQIEYMQNHIGEEFEGIVSGVMRFGFFVELVDLLAEGLVHVRDMEYDEKQFALIGRRSGMRYRLGDEVRIKVIRADTVKRIVDFIVV